MIYFVPNPADKRLKKTTNEKMKKKIVPANKKKNGGTSNVHAKTISVWNLYQGFIKYWNPQLESRVSATTAAGVNTVDGRFVMCFIVFFHNSFWFSRYG